MINSFESLANLLKKMQVEPKPKRQPPAKRPSNFRFTRKFCDSFCAVNGQSKTYAREGALIFLVSKMGNKSWRLMLARNKSITIGYYPEMSIEKARKKRDEILRGVK